MWGHRVLRKLTGGALAGVKCLEEAAMISTVKDKWELSIEWTPSQLEWKTGLPWALSRLGAELELRRSGSSLGPSQ